MRSVVRISHQPRTPSFVLRLHRAFGSLPDTTRIRSLAKTAVKLKPSAVIVRGGGACRLAFVAGLLFALGAGLPARVQAQPVFSVPAGAWALELGQDNVEAWYGWQTLALDLAAVSVFTLGMLEEDVAATAVGAGGFVLSSPALHLAHARSDRALVSLSVRLATPLLLGVVGGLASGSARAFESPRAALSYAAPGLAIGALLAVIVDGVILSRPDPDAAAALRGRGTPSNPPPRAF